MTISKITEMEFAELQTKNYEKVRPLKEVIIGLMSNQMAINRQLKGVCTAETILKRLYHDQLVGVNPAVYDASLSLWERVKGYATDTHDELYGRAIACIYGFRLPKGVKYDVDKCKCDLTLTLRGEDKYNFALYLKSIGGEVTNPEFGQCTDGINHINIYSKSRTALGKTLSMFYSLPDGESWKTKLGRFKTLEGLYHMLRVKDYYEHVDGKVITEWSKDPRLTDSRLFNLRRADGAEAIREGRAVKSAVYGGTTYRPEELSATSLHILVDALIRKLVIDFNGEPLWKTLRMVVNSAMPLKHYYVVDGHVRVPKYSELLPELYTAIVTFIDPEADDFDILSLTDRVGDIVRHYELEKTK